MIKKVTFILSGDYIDPASRDRGYFIAMELKKYGFYVEIIDSPVLRRSEFTITFALNYMRKFLANIVRKASLILKDGECVYFIQRDLVAGLPGLLNRLGECITILLLFLSKAILRRKITFDFDDAVYLGKPLATYLLTRVADVVTVGSHKLKEYATKLNPRVFLIPTSVNLDKYVEIKQKCRRNSKEKVTIIWVGSQSTLKYLRLLIKPISILLQRHPNINVKIMGARNFSEYRIYAPDILAALKHERVEFVDWNVNTYLNELAQADIGIAPLIRGEGEEAKCGKKIVEYMAMGIPVFASAIGENSFIIQDGKNGFLCKNQEEWVDKISLLIENKRLREIIGAEGLKTVRNNYSLENNVRKIANVLEKLF